MLFDNDGVLIQSEALHWLAWQKLCDHIGLTLDQELLERAVGRTSPQILKEILDQQKPGWTTAQFDLDQLSLKKNDFYGEVAVTQLKAYPGVREGLYELRARGIKTGVVSNGKRRELELGLTITGLLGLMDVVVSRDDVPQPKPSPMPYVQGATLLGLKPQDCFAIEDSPSGLNAALLSGATSFAVTSNFSREALAQTLSKDSALVPHTIVDSMIDFFAILRGLIPS